jgi:hypothetical protein
MCSTFCCLLEGVSNAAQVFEVEISDTVIFAPRDQIGRCLSNKRLRPIRLVSLSFCERKLSSFHAVSARASTELALAFLDALSGRVPGKPLVKDLRTVDLKHTLVDSESLKEHVDTEVHRRSLTLRFDGRHILRVTDRHEPFSSPLFPDDTDASDLGEPVEFGFDRISERLHALVRRFDDCSDLTVDFASKISVTFRFLFGLERRERLFFSFGTPDGVELLLGLYDLVSSLEVCDKLAPC